MVDAIGGQLPGSSYRYTFGKSTKIEGSDTAPETINFVTSTGLQPAAVLVVSGRPRFVSYDVLI